MATGRGQHLDFGCPLRWIHKSRADPTGHSVSWTVPSSFSGSALGAILEAVPGIVWRSRAGRGTCELRRGRGLAAAQCSIYCGATRVASNDSLRRYL